MQKKLVDTKKKEKLEEIAFKKEVNKAVEVRMRELETCERAKLDSDMRLKRECMKAEAEARVKAAQSRADAARMKAKKMATEKACAA